MVWFRLSLSLSLCLSPALGCRMSWTRGMEEHAILQYPEINIEWQGNEKNRIEDEEEDQLKKNDPSLRFLRTHTHTQILTQIYNTIPRYTIINN